MPEGPAEGLSSPEQHLHEAAALLAALMHMVRAQLLSEAERQKALLRDPEALNNDYLNAKKLLAERQAEAERHNK